MTAVIAFLFICTCRRCCLEEGVRRATVSLKQASSNQLLDIFFLFFFFQGIGYSLDYKKGPWFSTISRLLGHYYKNKLPNSENRLRYPYQS